jgi:deazaflavin-dependent oxidoreductase (nitroreductase family)
MTKLQAGRRTLRFANTEPLDAETTARTRGVMRLGAKWNVKLFRLSRGYLGSRWRIGRKFLRGIPVCLVTTTGRKSGQPRTVPLLYLAHGDGVVIVASQGGLPRHPDWYFNVSANPAVRVEVRGDAFDAVARVAQGDERARLWEELVELYPSFAAYALRAQREIPVIVCERTT